MGRFNGARLDLRLCLVALLFITNSIAMAQVTASMSGRIEDASGATIPGANITVTSLETGTSRTVTSDEAGNFRVLSLGVGQYEVKAEKTGFKAGVQTGINLVVGQEAVVNVKLEVGATQEQVTVTSDAPLVNTTTSSVAGLVNERQVKDLPLNGRSFDLLILLNPGTVNDTSAKQSSAKNGGNFFFGGNMFSVAGRRPSENLTLLNGVQYSGSGIGINTPGGASTQLLGVDAVREYNVVSDGYGAEFGQRAGAQVTMVTQSGANQLHGTVFEFLRNSDLDARNFFDYPKIGPFERNQFGGALGGPIRKDKTFVFGNYEGFRQRLALSNVSFVPDANTRLGFLPCGGGGPTCAPGTAVGTETKVPNLVSGILPFMAVWPAPNGPVLGQGIAESFNSPRQVLQEDFGTSRFDQIFSTKDSLSGVYTISDGYDTIPASDPLFATGITIINQVVSLQETHIFSPEVINTATAGFTRANYISAAAALTPFPDSLSFIPGQGPGGINLGAVGGTTITAAGLVSPYNKYRRNLFTYSDGVQIVRGKHQFSFGGFAQRIQQNDAVPIDGRGSVNFTNFTTMLQGTASQILVLQGGAPTFGWRSWEGAWYAQDSIQLRPNLTLRVGLRHEFSNGWSEVNGLAETALFVNGVIQTLPRISSNLLTENNSKWLFSPRLALAWDPFGKGKTSVRAAFGTYYDLVDWLNQYPDVTPPLVDQASYTNVPVFSILPANPSAPVQPPCGPGVSPPCITFSTRGFQSNFKVPTVESWNFTVEQQVTSSTALRVAYVGSHTYHQWVSADPNTVASQICANAAGCLAGGVGAAASRTTVPQGAQYIPVVTGKPNPFVGTGFYAQTEGYGNYNALQVEVIHRLAKGLQFRGNYTWAKNLDIQSSITQQIAANEPSELMDRNNPSRDYGPASFGVTSQASGNLSYELPFGKGRAWLNGVSGAADKLVSGWQFNAIVTLVSGLPFTPSAGANISGDGNNQGDDRPSINPAFTGNVITGTPAQWYNPNAFILPQAGTYGNLGRDTLTGPGLADVDLSLFKATKLSERVGLQFRAEVFNIMNHANFAFPNTTAFSGTAVSATAGVLSSTVTSSRQIQFGLKLVF